MAETFRLRDLPGWTAAVDAIRYEVSGAYATPLDWQLAGDIALPVDLRLPCAANHRGTVNVPNAAIDLVHKLRAYQGVLGRQRQHLRLIRPGHVYIEIPLGGDEP